MTFPSIPYAQSRVVVVVVGGQKELKEEEEEEDASKLAHFPLHLAHVLVSSVDSGAIWAEFIDIDAAVCILHYIFPHRKKSFLSILGHGSRRGSQLGIG